VLDMFDMGTHTFFVWLAYGVSFGSLATLTIYCLRSKKAAAVFAQKKIERLNKLN